MVIAVAVIAFIVFMERAQRRVVVQYPKRQVGTRMFGGDSTHMPLKINTAGVIPPIFASSILLVPATIAGFSQGGSGWISTIANQLAHGQPLYMALYAGMIIFFSYFYTAVVFNPQETADNLKKYGGFIPGIRPGSATAGLFRPCADAADHHRRPVPGRGLSAAGGADQQLWAAILLRRHEPLDYRFGYHGHCHPNSVPLAGTPV
jgi:preprotein translocase subunit SecY